MVPPRRSNFFFLKHNIYLPHLPCPTIRRCDFTSLYFGRQHRDLRRLFPGLTCQCRRSETTDSVRAQAAETCLVCDPSPIEQLRQPGWKKHVDGPSLERLAEGTGAKSKNTKTREERTKETWHSIVPLRPSYLDLAVPEMHHGLT